MNFAIVEFKTTQEIAIVSCKWINGGECSWPPYIKTDKVKKLILSHITPDASWKMYPVKIISLFGTYEGARKMLPRAEETSDLATDSEDRGRGKRMKRKRRYSSSSTSSEISCKIMKSPPPPPQLPSPPHVENYLYNSLELQTNEVLLSPSLLNSSSHNDEAASGVNSAAFQRSIMREFMIIRETQRQQSELMNVILEKLMAMESRNESKINSPSPLLSIVKKEIFDNLPLCSVEDLESLEDRILQPEVYEMMVEALSLSGGSSPDNCLKTLLKKLISNEVASLFSYCGKREKRSFCGLKICQLAFDAVRKNSAFMKVTDSELINCTKNWLRHAKARFSNEPKIL